MTASQVCVGDANDLAISVYCDEAGLHWRQEEPNSLTVGRRDKPTEIWGSGRKPGLSVAGGSGHTAHAGRASRRLSGGVRQYLPRVWREYSRDEQSTGWATMEDTLAGMKFINACIASSANGAVWTKI